MRNYYKYFIYQKTGNIINMENYFNYPIIMKNFLRIQNIMDLKIPFIYERQLLLE